MSIPTNAIRFTFVAPAAAPSGACAAAPRPAAVGAWRPQAPAAAAAPERDALLAEEIDAYVTAPPAIPFRTTEQARWSAAADAEAQEELLKKTQNPVSDLISLPLQNNFNTGVGLDNDLQYVLNVQPVVPFHLNADWNIITRTIFPIVYQPEVIPGSGNDFGLGDTTLTACLSPARPGDLIWGVGPVLLLPTSSGRQLGAGEWGLGASGVVLKMDGPWVYGALINNVWGFDGNVNAMLLQPFVNYNFRDGWYVVSAPVITANWEANSSNTWTVPLGGGGGRIMKFGKLPVNLQAQVFYNVETPAGGPEWTFRIQIQLLFPK